MYLEKEGLIQEELSGSSRKLSAYLDKQNDTVRAEGREYFFNGSGDTYDCEQVTNAIDHNVKGLKKTEARYFTFAISPSAPEIHHMRRSIADIEQALNESGEIIPEGFSDDLMRSHLKEYAVQCMDEYAQNFGHPQIKDNRDMLWFGVVEKDRYWKSKDKEVKKNSQIDYRITKLEQRLGKGCDPQIERQIAALRKQYILECHVRPGGSKEIIRPKMIKAGDNWHIHVTTSRRDITNAFSLSPNSNSRGSERHQLNGKEVRVGFNRERYKIRCEQFFDQKFAHRRLLSESYEHAKRLRGESAFAYEKQRLRDCAERRAEATEFSQHQAAGYRDYFESLLQTEKLDARQLWQLKHYLAQQIQRVDPQQTHEQLMDLSLDELRGELTKIDMGQAVTLPSQVQGIAANVGDRVINATGLEGFRPMGTSLKVLRKGVALRRAVDLRRETFDKWSEIYTDAWHRDNYTFQSVSNLRNTDSLLVQSEYLEAKYHCSLILDVATDHAHGEERRLVADFLKTHCPLWEQEQIHQFALECFGKDAATVRTLSDFETMAKERLLPLEAQYTITEAAARCEVPPTLETLHKQLNRLPVERAAKLMPKLDAYMSEHGQLLTAMREILMDKTITGQAREEALLRLANEHKTLHKTLYDLRSGVLKLLEKQNPNMTQMQQKTVSKKLMEDLMEVKVKHQAKITTEINAFISRELPGYELLVDRQSKLEEIIQQVTSDPEKVSGRLLDANNEIARQVSPQAEHLFEQHARSLFGGEVTIRNELQFLTYVDKHYSGEEAQRLKDSLSKVFAQIDERRRGVIQNYVNTQLTGQEKEVLRRQQQYINRFITKRYPIQVAKDKKEEFQRTVAAACRRQVFPAPDYRVFNHATREQIQKRAMAMANKIKVLSISPQQLAIKAAFKLVNVLTKGY